MRLATLYLGAISATLSMGLNAAVKTGPGVGQYVPSFSLADQNGRKQSLATIAGPNGAMLVFYRSADW
jgi:arginine repressor